MAGEVHRHAVDEQGDVGAVIGVEAAQEQLVGLAAAGVLPDEQPGGLAQEIGRRLVRTRAQLRLREVDRRGRLGGRRLDDGDGFFAGVERILRQGRRRGEQTEMEPAHQTHRRTPAPPG